MVNIQWMFRKSMLFQGNFWNIPFSNKIYFFMVHFFILLAILEVLMWTRIASISQKLSYLCLTSSRIKDESQCAQVWFYAFCCWFTSTDFFFFNLKLYKLMSHHVDVGNWTQVIWMSNQWFQLLISLSTASTFLKYSHFCHET